MVTVKPPYVPVERLPVVSDDILKLLSAACTGSTLEARRDTAILRGLHDCGVRLAEVSQSPTSNREHFDANSRRI
jgi:site-specific recombinase XerC